ncbi:MAG: adenosine deaminase [Xanthomonadales bacterium]|nr:adenosine deaminase [Xanthomonadales bacterium]NIN59066.1 adenosine deaminase [Xanthomonadales bacterium]NIN74370.1 adenosine deaminase [Xanthomonadales bacterium]NIO13175.1 adenosine deaminase [Xanthomonadales bacterium]NIP11459.1 adenosine deaminase [Xanthomonadales bacterium]
MIDPALPLCELHRHLDGSIRLQTILELADQHGISLPADDAEGLAPYVHIDESAPGLMAFIARFQYLSEVLVDADACRRVAYENVEDAQREGIDYIELRFSPWFMAERHGLDPAAVMEACADGIRAAERDTGVKANIIGILSRTYGSETCLRELEAILAHRDSVVAVDLAGDEAGYPAAMFREHFRRVREAGLHTTIHAGEADGPASVWSALRDLDAERIGHGFRAIEDPALVDYLAGQGIGLECCPTSNLHISAVPDYASHPIRRLAEAGVRFCLNTDDPGISNIDLAHEYEIAAPAVGLSPARIRQAQLDALEMAFLSGAEKDALRRRAATRGPG